MGFSFTLSKRLSTNGIDYTTECELPKNSELYYKLNLYSYYDNPVTSPAKDIIFVDILPHVGDTGVLLNTTDRLSEFSINLANFDVIGEITSGTTGEITQTKEFTVEYSSSYDPVRFGVFNDTTMGVDEWDNPTELESIKSIKIVTNENFYLYSGDTFSIVFKVKIPTDVNKGEVAYNSFAGRYSTYDEATQETSVGLGCEGPKVGVTVIGVDPREQSFIDLLQSIAMQQASLSSIIEGEALKIEKANQICTPDEQEELLKINASVNETITQITTMEELFIEFIELTCGNGCEEDTDVEYS